MADKVIEGAISSKGILQGIDTKDRRVVETTERMLGNQLGMILRDFKGWSNRKREWILVRGFSGNTEERGQKEAKDWESVGATDLNAGITIALL